MKPIELKLKGLHSFREEQTVDFQNLSEAGVFGIFGSTGSGKSSLLDAITLALYGKVERAPKNTQGIMNHAEDSLTVSFTFELKKLPVEMYRVERLYKRTKDDGLKTGSCRVIKLGEPPQVIADKERDVTQFIQDLLGLTHEDFTRAVVLPQGKFSEFLTLKGTERRKMLQRLFRLEKYGDALNDQLRQAIARLNVRIKEINAEQQGLGDASEETLKSFKQQHTEATAVLTSAKHERKEAAEHFQLMKGKWLLQQEFNSVKESLASLSLEKDEISEKEIIVENALKAARVLPVLEDWEKITETLKRLMNDLNQKEKQLTDLTKQVEQAQDKAEKAKATRIEKEPLLLSKQSLYKEGIRIQSAYKEENEAVSKAEETILKENKLLKEQETVFESKKTEQKQLDEQIQALDKEIQNLGISYQERQTIQNAFQQKKEIETAEAQVEEYRSNWKNLRSTMKNIEGKITEIQKEKQTWEGHGRTLYQKILYSFHHLSNQKVLLEQASVLISDEIDGCETAKRQKEEQALSARLVHSLETGKPCPVCGSVEHPNPSSVSEPEDHRFHQRLDQLKKLAEGISQGVHKVDRLKDRLEQTADRVSDYINQDSSIEQTELPTTAEKLELLQTEEWEAAVRKWLTEVKGAEQDIILIQESLETWLKKGQPRVIRIETLEREVSIYQTQMTELIEKADQRKQQIIVQKQEWQKHYPSYNYSDLDTLRDAVHQKEKHIEETTKTIDGLKKDREAVNQSLEQASASSRERMNSIATLQGSVTVRKATLEKLAAELNDQNFSIDTPFQQWLDQTEKEYRSLKTNESESEEFFRSVDKNRLAQEQALTKDQITSGHLQDRQQTLSEQLEVLKQEEGFTENNAIRQNFLSKDDMEHFKREIKQYREQETDLTQRLNRLKNDLSDQTVTLQDYEEAKLTNDKTDERLEEALKNEARLDNIYSELQKKADRYRDLQREKTEQEADLNRHNELQRLFRGNVFVEFVAEEQLHQICIAASKRLGDLTHARYALEVDSGGGFVIRDDANGGIKRPVSTLSGGETFLTSLALALSLSEQIQLSGDVPLQFFFLDEGFGTLDHELLDTVVTALEKLHMNQLSIGLISHVPELQARLSKKIVVIPAEPGGKGSRVTMEVL